MMVDQLCWHYYELSVPAGEGARDRNPSNQRAQGYTCLLHSSRSIPGRVHCYQDPKLAHNYELKKLISLFLSPLRN